MPNPTVRASATALPDAKSLTDVVDSIEDVVLMIEAVKMAVRSINSEDGGPLLVMLDVTADKLRDARDAVEALSGTEDANV